MSKHPLIKTRVSKRSILHRIHEQQERVSRENQKLVPTLWRWQAANDQPVNCLTLGECRDLRERGLGEFINRGKTFRRFDDGWAQSDNRTYKPSGRRGDSLNIDEPMMMRHAAGERYAVEAVKSWA